MSSKSFARDIIKIIDELVDSIDGYKYPDINDTSGKGMFIQGMRLHSIHLDGVHQSDALYDLNNV